MFRLNLFAWIQTYWRRPFVPLHNFCHPGSKPNLRHFIRPERLKDELWHLQKSFKPPGNMCSNSTKSNMKGECGIDTNISSWRQNLPSGTNRRRQKAAWEPSRTLQGWLNWRRGVWGKVWGCSRPPEESGPPPMLSSDDPGRLSHTCSQWFASLPLIDLWLMQ